MLKKLFNKFIKEEEGNVVEYIIVLAVMAVIIVALFPNLRTRLTGFFNTMLTNLQTGIGTP